MTGEAGRGAGLERCADLARGKGFSVTCLPADSPAPPLGKDALPAEGSVPVPAGKTVIVVNDAQRPTPTPWLLERLGIDWSRSDLLFAVASGSHLPPGEGELGTIFGPFLDRVRDRLVLHDAGAAGLFAGTTSRGTPVVANPCLADAAAVICLGSVEPHYFAGWTGGRKSLVPGLCSLETMQANHRLAAEGGGPGRPGECPVHRDLDEALALLEGRLRRTGPCSVTGLNVVTRGSLIHGWHCGPLGGVVDALSPVGEKLYGRSPGRRFPLVICLVEPPLDRDLYQALKAFENWKGAVAPGGLLVLVAPCGSGIGPPTFRQFTSEPPPLPALQEKMKNDYRLGDHKLFRLLQYLESGSSLAVVSPSLSRDDVQAVRVLPSLEAALDGAVGTPHLEALCVDDAGHTYPLD